MFCGKVCFVERCVLYKGVFCGKVCFVERCVFLKQNMGEEETQPGNKVV